MKPGEFVGRDGRTYTVASVALRHSEDTPTATLSLDGGAAILCVPHLHPDHPDFPAAVEALQALVPKEDVHPCVGRAMAMRGEKPFEWKSFLGDYHFGGGCVQLKRLPEKGGKGGLELCPDSMQDAFEAGRCYQRERGDE